MPQKQKLLSKSYGFAAVLLTSMLGCSAYTDTESALASETQKSSRHEVRCKEWKTNYDNKTFVSKAPDGVPRLNVVDITINGQASTGWHFSVHTRRGDTAPDRFEGTFNANFSTYKPGNNTQDAMVFANDATSSFKKVPTRLFLNYNKRGYTLPGETETPARDGRIGMTLTPLIYKVAFERGSPSQRIVFSLDNGTKVTANFCNHKWKPEQDLLSFM